MRAYVQKLKERCRVDDNPYFVALREGAFEREDFMETQIQFFFAVVFFPRPMAVLAARLPRPEMRLDLIENVNEEHGQEDGHPSHQRTFLTLLRRLGVTAVEMDRRALWPEVRAFNTVLAGLCFLDDTLSGLAALGIIEDLFSGISARIGQSVVARGWLPPERVVHYATHEELDVEHAEGFYRQLDEPYRADARQRYQIEQGLELGAYVFLKMYEDLYRARARRWTRTISGPHSTSAG